MGYPVRLMAVSCIQGRGGEGRGGAMGVSDGGYKGANVLGVLPL